MTAGELWAREVLAELRAARFGRRAWLRFLGRSFAYARERRGARMREHRQALTLGGLGLAAWVAAAFLGHPILAAAGAAWWVLVIAMVDWHLGMLEQADGTTVSGLGAPNLLTVVRAGTPPALIVLFGTWPGIAVLALAGATDVIDGALARRSRRTTRLGVWLDGSVDGFVAGAAAIGASASGRAPWWLAGLVLARVAAPWLLATAATFASATPPSTTTVVSGRIPGLCLFAGLALLAVDAAGGVACAAAGAAGGLATVAATAAKAARHKGPAKGL